jgi:hypothetical protein
MQTIGFQIDYGEEPTEYFVHLEKWTKPVKESFGHSFWTRVRNPPGPLNPP